MPAKLTWQASSHVTPNSEFIIPDVYGQDTLSTVNWLQENLSFSDEYLAQLVGVREELFSAWKRGEHTLRNSQVQKLKTLSTTINRLLSFLNFRRDLMMRVLEFHSKGNEVRRTRCTPPWLGTSLRDYLLRHGRPGIDEVDHWVQSLGSANYH
jgi:hypothetical protein